MYKVTIDVKKFQAAKSAGMTVVGILSSHRADELVGADYQINNFLEIDLQ